MTKADREEQDLRAVALQNVASILHARQKAERELVSAKEALERKTDELARSVARMRATLESTTDAIIATDRDGTITNLNEQFHKLWRIPAAIMARLDRTEIRAHLQSQLLDPSSFAPRLEEIERSDLPESFDTLELADGRVIERHSRVQLDESRAIGRVWTFREITHHRRAAAELREQREWFRVTLSSIGDAVITTDLASRVTFLNPVAEQMTGWPNAEACGRPLTEVFRIIHEGTREPAENPIARALREGVTVALANHTALLARDHREIAIEDSAAPIRDASGQVVGAVLVFHDVTERRRAESELREESRVLELLNATGTAIAARLDLQSLLQTVTDAATTLSGAKFGAFFYTAPAESGSAFMLYTLSGAPREAFEKFGHPRSTPIFRPTFEGGPPVRIADVLADPRYGRMPPHHGMPPGHLAVRSYLAVPVFSRTGAVFGGLFFGHPEPGVFTARAERLIVGVAAQAGIAIDNARLYEAAQREIAERGRTEQRLRDSETRLRVALETAALGTWKLDLSSHIVALDARCQEVFDLRDVPSMSLESFFALGHPDDRDLRQQALLDIVQGARERYDLEFRLVGGERWARASAKSVRNSQGTIVQVIGAVLDITDLMKARATTEERRRELEQLVEERTASLQQAVAQMEEFSYSVSHDLRAPLRAIQTYAQVAIEDYGPQLGPEGTEYLRRIVNAGGRMDRLTRDVLTYSKIARGDAPMAAISLDQLVVDTIEQYAPTRRTPGHIAVAHPLLPVLGHEPLLVQAISNLLANAIKFVAEGQTPRVRLWTDQRGGDVRLWVEDNGIGIQPEHQGRIWRMFERVHPKEKYDGTGIGLAIVRKAVERMGGSVGVESDGQTGSRFWIQLRAA